MDKSKKVERFSEIKTEFLMKATSKGGQYARMLRRLCASTQKWAEEHDADVYDFETKLSDLSFFLDSLQEQLNSGLWLLNHDEEKRSLTEEEEKKRAQWNQELWTRQDPKLIFQVGAEAAGYRGIYTQGLEELIAEYFAKSWMKDGTLEYWLVSALVLEELASFGENIKHRIAAVGAKDFLGRLQIYDQAKGDLRKIRELAEKHSFRRTTGIGIAVVAACYVPTVLEKFGFDDVLLRYGIYGGLAYFVVQSLVASRRMKKLEEEQGLLYDKMYDVWLALQGSIVNPTILKQKLDESAAKGAVWNTLVYSFVGIWIKRHAQVFLKDGESVEFE